MKKTSSIAGILNGLIFVLIALWAFAPAASAQQVTLAPFSSNFVFNNPIGIDHHEPTNGLIMSVNWATGLPNNLDIVNETSGAASQFSSLAGLTDELKIATVRTTPACQQFPVGDIFTGNGKPGEIVRIDKSGAVYPPAVVNPGVVANSSWVKLPGSLPDDLLRGALFVDRGCAFGGDLIVVTSNGNAFPTAPGTGDGAVWRVSLNGNAQLITRVLNPDPGPNFGKGVHLEGVITLPNDPAKYGPWAGTIIAGDENDNLDLTKSGRIWSITAGGVATPYTLAFTDASGVRHPVKPEDLDVIEAGGDFFGVDFGDRRILTAPAANFVPFIGDILVTQEFPCGTPGFPPTVVPIPCTGTSGPTTGLYVVHWNGSSFTTTPLTFSPSSPVNLVTQWEHVTISPRGDVGVLKTAFQSPITTGDTARFDITVTANGPAPSINVVLTDTLPIGVDGLGWSVTGANASACSPNPVGGGGLLTCNFNTLNPGDTRTITLTAKTTPAACPSLSNKATVTSTNDSNSANNNSTATITVNCPPQLAVVKTPDNGTFTQGAQVSFNIVVSNPAPTGFSPATNVTLTDTLPTNGGLTWESVSTSQGACSLTGTNNSSLSCTLGTIAAQGSVTVTVKSTATTPAAACQSQPNPVALAKADGNLQAQDSGSLSCTPQPQLAVVKTPDNGSFTQGSQVSFTIVVSNPAAAGAQSATNVQLTDVLPGNGGLVWETATTTQGTCVSPIVGNNLSCSLGTIAPQGSVTVTVKSTATTPAAACQSQPNPVALAKADGGLQAQDSGSLSCTPPSPQLKVVKTPDGGTFTQGSQVSFTIVVSNPAAAGAQSATNVTLTDALPGNGGLVWQTATTTQGTCVSPIVGNNLSCSLGTIAPQGSVTVTVTSTATTPAAACQSQPNPVALAKADGGLQAQDSGSLSCTPPPPQLKVVKTPDGGTFNYLGQASFTIVVSNPAAAGAQSATNVTLTDALPGNGGLVWQTATTTQGTCVSPIVGNALSCNLGTIAPQGSVTVVVTSTATTPAAACQSQPNPVALAKADGGLQAQDSGSLTCTPPSITIIKTPDGGPVGNGTFNVGDQIFFDIKVTSGGPGTATSVQVTDTLPTPGNLGNWQVTSVTPTGTITPTPTAASCSIAGGNALTCNLGSMAANATVTIRVTTSKTGGADATACNSNSGKVDNTAKVTANGGLSAQDTGFWNCKVCVPALFDFTGNSASTGTAGNIRKFTVNGISVNASAFARVKSNGAWEKAYLGSYGPGLGVTDSSESGNDPTHKVDNVGTRLNYVLFEFSTPVIVNRAFLDAIGKDSDISVWIGNKTDPFNNHLTLSDALLSSLTHEENLTSDVVTSRWADINGSNQSGNVLVIAAWDSDDTPEDEFKIHKLDIVCGAVACPAGSKFDFSGNTSTTGTFGNIKTFSVAGTSVNVSAFSRDSSQAWATAYLGLYGPGLGVTDRSESGNNPTHKVDNQGGRNNFVLFEFSSPVIIDRVFLDSIGGDSDMSLWIGTQNDPFHNHLTLSNALLNSLTFEDNPTTASVTSRWADINSGSKSGNVLIIAASVTDTTPDDEFKISKVEFKCK